MAVVLVLLGGMVGFVTGVATLVFTDLGLLAAFGLWMSVGLAATLLALAVAVLAVAVLARLSNRPAAHDLHA